MVTSGPASQCSLDSRGEVVASWKGILSVGVGAFFRCRLGHFLEFFNIKQIFLFYKGRTLIFYSTLIVQ